jgi:hypothetical protein
LFEELQLDRFFSEHLERHRGPEDWAKVVELLAVNRLCAPGSELSIHERWFDRTAMDQLLDCGAEVAGKDRLYRALDKIVELKPALEKHLARRWQDLFGGNDIFGMGGHGWLDSYYGLILPGAVSAFGIFFLRQYMLSIPDELIDAARIDGAGEFRIYSRIILPLTKPALAATGIFTFMYSWEDFFWPLIIINSPDLYTVPLGLTLYVVRNRTAWDIVMAGSVLATLPMIVTFILFQRHIIKGITLTGIKG